MRTAQIEATTLVQDSGQVCRVRQTQDIDDSDYLDRRSAERVPIECPVRFISEERRDDESKVEGTLCDLSKSGCRIFSPRPPCKDTQITLILHLPDGEPPLYLIGTTVRHVRGYEFGAEFLPLTPQERRRLQAIIFKFVTWSVYSLRRPAFRIA
jgi:c-di-GMP-binding flagellar brake protein YcgR